MPEAKKKEEYSDQLHPSHDTRISFDASSYDEICTKCRATDILNGGWGNLRFPCPVASKKEE